MRAWAIGVAFAAVFGLAGLAHAATPCAGLTAQALPHATVTSAADTPAGQLTACKIEVTARPSPDSDIGIEIWIPEGAAWNGRYVQFGNGGFAGQILSKRLEAVAALGYAVAMTDDGHQTLDGTDARWAIGHPQKVIDFGWRALKETTDAAKALIGVYEGAAPKYTYFQGCSDGGREALMEAQRFPDDFDGIVAGAPAYNFTGLMTLAASDAQALASPQGFLDADALKTLETGALATCGGDKYVTDPESCRFDPAILACPRGEWLAGCLTPGEVASARAIYIGLGGGKVYPGNSPGAEAEPGAWATWITGPAANQLHQALIFKFATGFWGGFVNANPNYDVMKVDVASAPKASAAVAKVINATDPDLSRFRKHGGKLIQYHGWNDPAIPAAGSIVYYEDVAAKLHDVDGFYRLYLIPGMLHCGGGPGPSGVDWLGTLRTWVEQGQAPAGLVATGGPRDQPPPPGAPTQRLCPYPKRPTDGDRCV
jgi:hypothetical protein